MKAATTEKVTMRCWVGFDPERFLPEQAAARYLAINPDNRVLELRDTELLVMEADMEAI